MKNRISFFSLILLSVSCSYSDRDFNLTDNERNFFAAFKKGDTIYYESSNKDVDSILVLGINSEQKRQPGWLMASPAYNDVYVSIKHLPIDHYTSLIQGTDRTDTTFNQIISILKIPQEKKVEYAFQFKRFCSMTSDGLGIIHTDTILINGIPISNYYILEDDNIDRDSAATDIHQMYWTQNGGLVAYKYVNGTYWVKKKRLNK